MLGPEVCTALQGEAGREHGGPANERRYLQDLGEVIPGLDILSPAVSMPHQNSGVSVSEYLLAPLASAPTLSPVCIQTPDDVSGTRLPSDPAIRCHMTVKYLSEARCIACSQTKSQFPAAGDVL